MKKTFLLVTIAFINLIYIHQTHAKGTDAPFVAVGQGIAVPAKTSPINYSNGFTHTNPAVARSYDGIQLSLEHNTDDDENDNNDNSGNGAELGLGNGNIGLGIGYYKRECDNCEGKMGAILGFGLSSFSLGLGFHEDDNFSLGFIFNPNSQHRIGLTVDLYQGPNEDDDIRSYGVGYGYIGNDFIFSLDASKRDHEVKQDSDEIIKVTPGIELQTQKAALSVSYDTYLNDDNESHDSQVWFGGGFRFSSGSFTLYHDYVSEWALVLALNF